MTEKSKANPILGFSDSETVKLDFDHMSFGDVSYWSTRTMNWFKLKGFVILKSSRRCYHVVFDRKVTWKQNMRVVAWVALHSRNRGLAKWFIMQCIKGCSTLRMSPKHEKPPPRIVYRYGRLDQSVKDFLKYREIVKKITQKVLKNRDLSRSNPLFLMGTYVLKAP